MRKPEEKIMFKVELSKIPAYYKQEGAADYLGITEDQLVELREEELVKYAVLAPDGEVIYSIDELDKWGKIILMIENDLLYEETDKTE